MEFMNYMEDRYKIVWYLNNYCNFNCEYCLDNFGRTDPKNNKLIPLSFVKNACKNLLSLNIPKYQFTLFGGETTLYPDLPKFIDTLYDSMPNKISNMMFTSNASRSVNYFKNFLHYDDTFIIRLSAHMEHWNPHFFDIVDFLCENNIRVFTEIMFNLNYKELVFSVADEIIKRMKINKNLKGRIKPVFNNVPFENYFYNYSNEDLKRFEEKNTEFGYTSYMYKKDKKILGKYCIIGSNKCAINPYGVFSNFCLMPSKIQNNTKSIFTLPSHIFKKNVMDVVRCQTQHICLHAPTIHYNTRQDAKNEMERIINENN